MRHRSTHILKAWECSRKTSFIPTIRVRELYRAGASRGAIDPCFPAKIGISHVYNLLQEKHRKKACWTAIFFPMYDVLHSPLVKIVCGERLPDRHGYARNSESGIHERE